MKRPIPEIDHNAVVVYSALDDNGVVVYIGGALSMLPPEESHAKRAEEDFHKRRGGHSPKAAYSSELRMDRNDPRRRRVQPDRSRLDGHLLPQNPAAVCERHLA